MDSSLPDQLGLRTYLGALNAGSRELAEIDRVRLLPRLQTNPDGGTRVDVRMGDLVGALPRPGRESMFVIKYGGEAPDVAAGLICVRNFRWFCAPALSKLTLVVGGQIISTHHSHRWTYRDPGDFWGADFLMLVLYHETLVRLHWGTQPSATDILFSFDVCRFINLS